MSQLFTSSSQKYWRFSFNISLSNECSELISFRVDSFHLLVVQGTLKSLLQYHNLKASVLPCLAFFAVQLSHPYMTTRKTTALTTWIFVGKVLSLLLNTLLGLSWLSSKKQTSFNLMAAITIHSDFGAQENKICHYFHCFPIYLP